ncbi:hypothetical protein ABIE65_001021 [Constrictibacter sp. MBR-5]|uniref:hypothetical protein n=1 Tax=Constrictibacter sp. MBR-5 TaxID=3156467 RepID=UPI00339B37C9
MSTPAAAKQVIDGEVVVSLEKRRGGRPKGLPKTGGRTKGTPNKFTVDQRQRIAKMADPFEFLAQVVNGRGRRVRGMVLSPEMRLAAALKLAEKLLPNAKEPDGPTAPDVTLNTLAARSGSDPRIELARRAVFMLTQGARAMDEQADPYQSRGALPPEPDEPDEPEPVAAPEPAPAPRPYRYYPGLNGPSAFYDD